MEVTTEIIIALTPGTMVLDCTTKTNILVLVDARQELFVTMACAGVEWGMKNAMDVVGTEQMTTIDGK